MLKQSLLKIIKVVLPFVVGGGILWWVYRDFDFATALSSFAATGWVWLCLSLVFEVLSHILRGLRWQQTLRPLGLKPRANNCIQAIFLSYASNFVIPRLGEVARCGVLSRYENISFAKSFGTVITERIVDAIILGGTIIAIILLQDDIFTRFFEFTGMRSLSGEQVGFYLLLATAALAVILLALWRFHVWNKFKTIVQGMKEGIYSLRDVDNKPLFVFYSLAIWFCYFLQFYLAFFAFPNIAQLPLVAALACFAAGSVGVIIPTPNGTGSWHFAVITMMVISGIPEGEAALFALLVHGTQTLMLIVLGVWALLALPLINRKP